MKAASIMAPLKLQKRSAQRAFRLRMESLEDRRLLAASPHFVPLTAEPGPFVRLDTIEASRTGAVSYIAPTSAVPFSIETSDLRDLLASAPMEFTAAAFDQPLEFSVPAPDGTLDRFEVVEAPIMHPELAAKYPEMKTYRGQGIDNPAATIRFDVTPQGFHAQVLGPDGAYYIDPYYHLDTSVYVSYARDNFAVSEDTQQLRESFRELGIVDDGVLVTENGSYTIATDGTLSSVETGDRFLGYSADSYQLNDDGSATVKTADGQRVVYDTGSFHLHRDGTLHVHASSAPKKEGGGCPGCGGAGCAGCSPVEAAHAELNVLDVSANGTLPDGDEPDTGTLERTGDTLRTYRLANATTVEYTNFHGGSKAAGLAAVVTAINRVTGVYEVELTIRMELVPNNDELIFTNFTGDSYTNNNGFAMLSQNQSVIDNVIGNANYDIGHVFSTGGGGVAGLGVVGRTGQKARGVTGLGFPVNDPFYIDYVAHEMGHQYGGNHTFNGNSGSCSGGNRNGSTAYEPGSGSTIQAYAGICGNDNLQNNSDPYFHSVSLDEMISYVDGFIPGVGTRTSTGNTQPTADAGPNYEIPAGTPFMLTGVGTDPDDDALTYNWEQRDLGPQSDLNAPDQGSIPLFRSRLATISPTRYFPRIQNLVSNNLTQGGEKLPTLARRMDFRLTVRDNASGGGGVDTDDMWVDINETGAPFQVTSLNTGGLWLAGETETITWDVAGTDSGQINTPNVDILLSSDGGFTYPLTLASAVPNTGSYDLTVPNIPETSQARVMVKGSGNIFFDINNQDFSIIPDDTAAPTTSVNVPNITIPGGTSTVFSVTYTDNQAVDTSTIGEGDLEVVAPDSSILPVQFVSTSTNVDTTPVVATYELQAPGGIWDFYDNGTYSIRLLAGEVGDVDDNLVSTQIIDTFDVVLDPPPGDFNADGNLSCEDVNMLTMAIASSDNDPSFDLTGEGVVNLSDLNIWIEDLKGTLLGDANLDFVVDGTDFLAWNSHKFTAGNAWCSGDFNADGFTDGSDFVIWNNNKFQSALDTAIVLRPIHADAQQKDSVVIPAQDAERVETGLKPAAAFAPLRVTATRSQAGLSRAKAVDYALADLDDTEEGDCWEWAVDTLHARITGA